MMKTKLIFVVGISIGLNVQNLPAEQFPSQRQTEHNVQPKESAFAQASNAFALDLYWQLARQNDNFLFSPASISFAMAMTYAGAHGPTQTEMAKTLHFPKDTDVLFSAIRDELSLLKTGKGYELEMENRLWSQQGMKFLPEFLETMKSKFDAELGLLDFRETEAARKTINDWIEQKTREKIEELIPSGVLTEDTKLVLTNALYFKGEWIHSFEKERTREDNFYVTADETAKVQMMNTDGSFRYAEADGVQILEMGYKGRDLSMIVLLPSKKNGLADLEGKLESKQLKQWLGQLSPRQVVIFLPKFKSTTGFQLGDTLAAMGMPSAFDEATADFSGMTGNKDLFIGEVVHKAFADVDEKGTEAAAATAIVMRPTSAPIQTQEPVIFRADHPFAFMIRDNRSGNIIFLGRFIRP